MESNEGSVEKLFLKSAAAKILLAVLILCIAAVLSMYLFINPGDKIAKGIKIAGIDVSEMTVEEAETAVSGERSFVEQEIAVYTANDSKVIFKGADIDLKQDVKKTVEYAYSIGRSKNFFENIWDCITHYFNPQSLNYVCSYDREVLSEILYRLGVEANGELKNYILEYDGGYVSVKKGVSGQSKNVDRAIDEVELSLEKGIYEIFVNLDIDMPVEPDTDSLYNEIYIKPEDARYEVVDGKVLMIPETVGRQIDKIEAASHIDKLKNGGTITLKLIELKPDITLEILNHKLFNHILAQYSTSYSTNDIGRKTNVELAAKKIDGVILAPGAVFSFNETVGPRTRGAGFRDAPVFENGETVQGIGGGVCQVSSTLYSAVLYADLKITLRQNHSQTVAYVPKGQDATVSYGVIDFKFENNTAYPIKIVSGTKNGKLTVSIHGTKPENEKTVKIINNLIETRNPTAEKVQDENLLTGLKKVLSKGKTGYTVETVRVVLENGVEVKSEIIGRSVYKMVPTKVAVGAKVPEALPPLPATPPPVTPPPEEVPVIPPQNTIEEPFATTEVNNQNGE